jgi:hypothetical protein
LRRGGGLRHVGDSRDKFRVERNAFGREYMTAVCDFAFEENSLFGIDLDTVLVETMDDGNDVIAEFLFRIGEDQDVINVHNALGADIVCENLGNCSME